MNVLATTESDLILRIRRSLARRMGAGSRLLAALLLSAACAVTLPSCGTRDKSTDADSAGVVGAEVSSEVFKSQTVAAGEEAIRAEPSDDGEVDWAAVRSTPPDVVGKHRRGHRFPRPLRILGCAVPHQLALLVWLHLLVPRPFQLLVRG